MKRVLKRTSPPIIHGFTLIELLVVVAILAVLISILLPALTAARERAKTIVCQTNVHSIGLGYQFYANDNNGIFTIHRYGVPYLYRDYYGGWAATGLLLSGKYMVTLDTVLKDPKGYLQDANVLFCPNTDRASPYTRPFMTAPWTWMAAYSNRPYWTRNGQWIGYNGGWYTPTKLENPKKFDQVPHPSNMGLVGDLVYDVLHVFHNVTWNWNVVFTDGHAQTVTDPTGWLREAMTTYPPMSSLNNTSYFWVQMEIAATGRYGGDFE